jgi:hypothetical protein
MARWSSIKAPGGQDFHHGLEGLIAGTIILGNIVDETQHTFFNIGEGTKRPTGRYKTAALVAGC